MGRIKVKYLNVYGTLTGKKEEFIVFHDELTLAELLQSLFRSYGKKFKDTVVAENNAVKPHVWILLNQERVKDLDATFADGDTVVFSWPPMGG